MKRSRSERRDARRAPQALGWEFASALGLLAFSGAAALAHELLWTRRLIDLLGASGESIARVFGCFFLGLALGSAWASRLAPRLRRPWRAAAIAELAVGLLAIPALVLPESTAWIWPALGPERLIGPLGAWIKLAISALVLLPPTVAMGMVLPFVASAVLSGARELGRHGVWLYAANTLGGVVGLGAVVVGTLPFLGAAGSMIAAIAVNGLVALGMAARDRPARRVSPRREPPPGSEADEPAAAERATPARTRWPLLPPGGVAFVSGFGVIAAEVIGLELVMLLAPLSFYAPAAVLITVILVLGLAALIAPALIRQFGPPSEILPGLLAIVGFAMALTPPLFLGLALALGDIATGSATIMLFLLKLGLIVLLSTGPAFLLAGLIFPVAVAWPRDASAGERARSLGRLIALNGVGGVLGAEAAYRLILPAFGVHGGLAVVGGLYTLAALGLCLGTLREQPNPSIALARLAGAVLVVGSLGFGWIAKLPHMNPFLNFEIVDQQFGREGAVAVVEREDSDRGILLSNQYMLGTTGGRWDQERQAHLPLVLHPEPRSVAFIGVATGITPGAALAHDPVASVIAIELSPLVVRAADRYFGAYNRDLTRDPRVSIAVEDGRTYLAACEERFDVVCGDLFLPWAPGEARLFSVEHFKSVHGSLRPGGVFCQWLPLYQLTPEQLAVIAESVRQAFPTVHLFRSGFPLKRPALALVGFKDGGLDWDVAERRCEALRQAGQILDPTVRHAEAVAMLYLGTWPPERRETAAPVNTLRNLRIELSAGRERLTGDAGSKYLHDGRWLDWVLKAQEASRRRPGVPVDRRIGTKRLGDLMDLGYRISVWEYEQSKVRKDEDRPAETDLPEVLRRRLPRPLVEDDQADWNRWPGRSPVARRQRPLSAAATRLDGWGAGSRR